MAYTLEQYNKLDDVKQNDSGHSIVTEIVSNRRDRLSLVHFKGYNAHLESEK